jgi:hypothetical protein
VNRRVKTAIDRRPPWVELGALAVSGKMKLLNSSRMTGSERTTGLCRPKPAARHCLFAAEKQKCMIGIGQVAK